MNADERKSAASIIACYPINESTYNIDRLLFDSAVKMLAHIDSQAEQIATLKTALVDHIAQDKIAQMGGFGFVLDTATCDPYGDARKQLARELPEIFAEDQ